MGVCFFLEINLSRKYLANFYSNSLEEGGGGGERREEKERVLLLLRGEKRAKNFNLRNLGRLN